MSNVPIQEIMDVFVSILLLFVAYTVSTVWILLAPFPILILLSYLIFESRVSDGCMGFVVYESRWEAWHGTHWQARMTR